MTAPFIFIGTHRIKPGKREEYLKYFEWFCTEVVERQEPRLHSFWGYVSPDSDDVTVVQIHPDADSMLTHMKVGREHFSTAYAEYLEPESTLQIYGTLSDELKRAISAVAKASGGVSSVTIREPSTGFDRLPRS